MERFLRWTEDLRNSHDLVNVADETRNFELVTNEEFNSQMNDEYDREHSNDPFNEKRTTSHSIASGLERQGLDNNGYSQVNKTPLDHEAYLEPFSKFRFSKRLNETLVPLSTKRHGVSLNMDMKRLNSQLKGVGRTYCDLKKVLGGRLASESVGQSLRRSRAMNIQEGTPKEGSPTPTHTSMQYRGA